MPLEDEIDTLDSSPGVTDDKQAEAPAAADSSPATGEKPKTVLDVVRDVGRAKAPDSPTPVAEESAAEQQPETAPEGDEEEAAEQAEPSLPYYKDPRFQRVLRQRKQARERAAQYEQDATRYRNVQGFLNEAGVTGEEAAQALHLAALLKRDRVKAWEALEPIVRGLLEDVGRILPNDLQDRVVRGELSAEAAQELSQARARAKLYEQQRKAETEIAQKRSFEEAAQACVRTAEEWSAERAERDPNFSAKVPLLQREIAWLQSQEGRPNTPDGVKAQLAKAYRNVNSRFTPPAAAPATKPAVQPMRASGVSTTAAPAQKPKSVLDIVRARGAV